MKVRCIKITNPHSGRDESPRDSWFTVGKEYLVLEIYLDPANKRSMYRIEADNGVTPVLTTITDFVIVSGDIPSSWVAMQTDEMITFGPSAWMQPGFWEAFFDRDDNMGKIYKQEKIKMNI